MAIDYQAVGRIITPPGGESGSHWLEGVEAPERTGDGDEAREGSIDDWHLVERVSPRAIYGRIY